MPALRFSTDPCRLLDCLGLPTRAPEGNDPFLSLRGEDLGQPGTPTVETDATTYRYQRRYTGGVESETVFRQLRSGVWERRDTLRNVGTAELVLTEIAARFDLERGMYELYSQAGGWCTESQGGWEPIVHGSRVLHCEHGRTSQGSTPFAALRCAGNDHGVAFHLLPCGNWRITVQATRNAGWQPPTLSLFLGPDEPDGLRVVLQPGEEYALPVLLLIGFAADQIEAAAPPLHAVMADTIPALPGPPPLAYNTWFHAFAELDVPQMQRQVLAAAEVGCEVFIVDAGWYGSGEGWACQGDWQEKTDRAFHGRMRDFADYVRASGLGFGLWMESEAIHPNTPLGKNPPAWLRRGPTGMFWPDLTLAPARAWVRDEIARLLDTYQAVWLKIDFNQPIGPDPYRGGMQGYYATWYDLLDEFRARFPQTFFENCGSGAMRLDLESYRHYHGHFLSDTVHPVDSLRITQGTLLRVPPGGLYTWTVLCPAGPAPYYPHPAETAPPRAVTSGDATWYRTETVDIGFALATAMPGMMGFSGNLADLAPEVRQDVARWAGLWKENRIWLRHSQAHLLTPVHPLLDDTGWAAFEYADADHALVLAFRLHDLVSRFQSRLRSVDPNARYSVRWLDGREPETRSGQELLSEGLAFRVPRVFGVAGALLTRQPA